MRKSVILLIAILYVVSIVVVTFFGMKISMDQFKVYMSSISLKHEDMQILDDGSKYLYVKYDQELIDTQSYIEVFVDYDVGPENASNPEKVQFSLTNATYTDEEGNETVYAEVKANGTVIFYQKRTVYLYIKTTDGSNLEDKMMIRCR